MINRRQFFKKALKIISSILILPFLATTHRLLSQTKRRKLPADISRNELMTMDPKTIDASAIPITHLNDFLTMGVTDQDVDINKWRLKIHGNLREPMELTLPQIQKLPSVGKKVLMVCPGIFANQGYWKGIDMKALLKNLKPGKDAEKVVFRGLNGGSEKMETFPFADVAEGSVFLAYEVNGVPLPRRHGYPLRIVARDYYGDDWVKYVFDMEVM